MSCKLVYAAIIFCVFVWASASGAVFAKDLDLANRPGDNLALEHLLLDALVAGHYEDFILAHELIGFARLIYPDEASVELEDRLLNLAAGKCHRALRPIKKSGLNLTQARLIDQIHKQCPTEWQAVLHLSAWVSKPARTNARITEIIPEDNSFIDQVCTVFSVGCGPVQINPSKKRAGRLTGQAIWHLRHLRRANLIEHIRLQFQKDRALRGDTHNTQAYVQYGWQITRPRYVMRPNLLLGVQQQDSEGLPYQQQSVQAGALSMEIPIGRSVSITSQIQLTYVSLERLRTRIQLQENGLNWTVTPHVQFSYLRGQSSRSPPATDSRGPSATHSERFRMTTNFLDRFTLQFSRTSRTERFANTMFYLTEPHQIDEIQNTVQMDISFKKGKQIWIRAEDAVSRSIDATNNYKDTRLSAGFRLLL